MNESEQRVRDACLAWDGTSLDDRDLSERVRVGDLRALLRDLDEARAICYAWERRCDEARAKLARAEDFLRRCTLCGADAYFAEQEPTDSPPFCQRHDCPLPCPACEAMSEHANPA